MHANVTKNTTSVLENEKRDPAVIYRFSVNPLRNNGTHNSGVQEEVGARDSIPISINQSGFRDSGSGQTKQLLHPAGRNSRALSATGGEAGLGKAWAELPQGRTGDALGRSRQVPAAAERQRRRLSPSSCQGHQFLPTRYAILKRKLRAGSRSTAQEGLTGGSAVGPGGASGYLHCCSSVHNWYFYPCRRPVQQAILIPAVPPAPSLPPQRPRQELGG